MFRGTGLSLEVKRARHGARAIGRAIVGSRVGASAILVHVHL